MLATEADARALVRAALEASEADETEVFVSDRIEATTRFATDGITQNVLTRDGSLTVRAVLGRRSGRATTTSFAGDDVRATAARALAAARVAAEDPDHLAVPGPQEYAPARPLDERALAESPGARADRVRTALERVRAAGLRPAGTATAGADLVAIGNSRGLFACHREGHAGFAMTALSDSSAGFAERNGGAPDEVDVDLVTATAIDKALRSADPETLPPGDYTVVLEPSAVTDFLLFLAHCAFSGLAYNEGRSVLSGRLGEALFAPDVTIADDALDPLSQGAPFDGEGMPRRRVVLVDAGVARAVVHDRRTAAVAGTTTTGHALPQPNTVGPLPLNLVMGAGSAASVDDLVRATKSGVLVTQLHYVNVVDPKQVLLTGMTRNGTFRIEDGRVTRPVRNLRFTDTAVRLLAGVEGVTRERLFLGTTFGGTFVVPGLRSRAFAFSSGTEF